MLELKESLFPIVVDIVGDRRSPKSNRFPQHFFYRDEKLSQLFSSNRRGPSTGANAGAEQRLVGINIAHPAQQFLIEQRTLDGSLTSPKQRDKSLQIDIKGLDPPSIEIHRNAE